MKRDKNKQENVDEGKVGKLYKMGSFFIKIWLLKQCGIGARIDKETNSTE